MNQFGLCIEAMLGISLYSYPYLIIAYVFSSTKLEKRGKQVLPGGKGVGAEREGGGRGREGPNNVCTYE
jgi:hypothetical protein